MNRLRNVCTLFLGLVMTACGGGSDMAERISSAEMAYATGDASSLRRICDEIMDDNAGESTLTAEQLGRMSILYMELYDHTDDSDALDMATECYRSAFEEDADSASYFYAHLPAEQYKYGMSLTMLVQSMDNPVDISDALEADSCGGHEPMPDAVSDSIGVR